MEERFNGVPRGARREPDRHGSGIGLESEAIILAGGFGTRIARVVPGVPKPMAPVANRPFLEYVLAGLAVGGVRRAVLAVGYMRERITEHFGDAFAGMEIRYSCEDTPLLTGGAVKKAAASCKSRTVFVLNGDTYFDVPYARMAADHRASGARLSVAVKEMRDFERYGTVRFDENGWITGFEEKRPMRSGYVNGGVYLMDASLLSSYPDVFSFEKQALEADFRRNRARAFVSGGYFIDIGVPEDYERARKDFERHE